MARFLEDPEKLKTRELFLQCFPDEEFVSEYYGTDGEALSCMTAVAERDGRIVSMAQALQRKAVYADEEYPVYYIAGVCTDPSYRHQGLMDEVLGLILKELRKKGEAWCFLMPVDRQAGQTGRIYAVIVLHREYGGSVPVFFQILFLFPVKIFNLPPYLGLLRTGDNVAVLIDDKVK